MSDRSAKLIIAEAADLLKTARFGLEDMRTRPERAKTGLRNAVVFGRMVTFALQNLRSVVLEFDLWYEEKQREMKANLLMRYFHDLRTTIEKKASTPVASFAYIASFGPADMKKLEPAPPGARAFFIGDENGGSGWEIQNVDGSTEKYYVSLPTDKVVTGHLLTDAPDELKGHSAMDLVAEYLSFVEAILNEAKLKFV